jgi:hypothetical protein
MPNKYTQPPRENKNAAASPNLPVKTFRLGRIKAAVWEYEGDQKFYSVTFARTYMDEANKYHDTDSFGRDDLPAGRQAGRSGAYVHLRAPRGTQKQTERVALAPHERPVIPAALFCFLGRIT